MAQTLLWSIQTLFYMSRILVKSADIAHLPPVYNFGQSPPASSLVMKPYILPSILINTIMQSSTLFKKNLPKRTKPFNTDPQFSNSSDQPLSPIASSLSFTIQPNHPLGNPFTLKPTLFTASSFPLKPNLLTESNPSYLQKSVEIKDVKSLKVDRITSDFEAMKLNYSENVHQTKENVHTSKENAHTLKENILTSKKNIHLPKENEATIENTQQILTQKLSKILNKLKPQKEIRQQSRQVALEERYSFNYSIINEEEGLTVQHQERSNTRQTTGNFKVSTKAGLYHSRTYFF